VRASIDALQARAINALHLSLSRYAGDVYWLATQADGTVTRLDAVGNPWLLGEAELTAAAARLAGTNAIAEQGLMNEPDTYFIGQAGGPASLSYHPQGCGEHDILSRSEEWHPAGTPRHQETLASLVVRRRP
jgi:hypothetical protein